MTPPPVGTTPPPGPLPEGQSRDRILAEVGRALDVVPEGTTVLVALSGGPDSTALAYLTAEARPDLQLVLGHVRHGLRDDREDVRVVTDHARFLGARLEVAEVVVRPTGEGVEAAARAHRYAALRRQAREAGAAFVLLGHTAEDQAETVLMRLARGTGVPGLGGMAVNRGGLLRPMLRLRRSDVRRFVVHEGLAAVEDPMNRDRTFTRTIARSEVLPVLARLGPDPVAALARLADVARDDADKLDLDASQVLVGIVRRYGPVWLLRRDDLDGLHPAIANRVVRDVVSHARGTDDPPSASQVARVLSLEAGAAADLPGVSATAGGGWLAIGPQDLVEAPDVPLAVPGRTRWGPGRVDVVAIDESSARPADRQLALDLGERWSPPDVEVPPGLVPPGGRDELGRVVLGEVHVPELVVRARRPGDRIRTGGGTRKLQDVLVDAGVPRLIRDLVPLVAHGDRVLWVPGIAVDAAALAAGRRSPRLLLHLAG
ncbi:MAG: tRNA lysidine(34) synthetase TilS [Actinobacteria bacterium]|nr:tRNA lysidine(34) synthetase TilS [Actinomycetota bacterium]